MEIPGDIKNHQFEMATPYINQLFGNQGRWHHGKTSVPLDVFSATCGHILFAKFMAITRSDLQRLQRLRDLFLEGGAAGGPYWQDDEDLAVYDRFFGQRIAWKWEAVLGELTRRKWKPSGPVVVDWGCGSGVAGRAFLNHFPESTLVVSDHSPLAQHHALQQAREAFPHARVRIDQYEEADILLISHVINELNPEAEQALRKRVEAADTVIWVEPGTHAESRALIRWREESLASGAWQVVAPCPHAGACGLGAEANARHWCHHFAATPNAIHQDADWSHFARLLHVDLRSLPYSYLVLDKRRETRPAPGLTRILGTPRFYKGFAKVLGCESSGVQDQMLQRRDDPTTYKRWDKHGVAGLERWTRETDKILKAEEADSTETGPTG
jgi:hypothetical protein